MCPVCLASVGLIVASAATSAGGLTALAVKLSRKKTNEVTLSSNDGSSRVASEQPALADNA